LKDAKTHVAVTTADFSDAENPQGILFTDLDEEFSSVWAVDACLSTGAAPFYFNRHIFAVNGVARAFFDGGLISNNPSMLALMLAL